MARVPITFAYTIFLNAIDHPIVFIFVVRLFLDIGQRTVRNGLAHVGG